MSLEEPLAMVRRKLSEAPVDFPKCRSRVVLFWCCFFLVFGRFTFFLGRGCFGSCSWWLFVVGGWWLALFALRPSVWSNGSCGFCWMAWCLRRAVGWLGKVVQNIRFLDVLLVLFLVGFQQKRQGFAIRQRMESYGNSDAWWVKKSSQEKPSVFGMFLEVRTTGGLGWPRPGWSFGGCGAQGLAGAGVVTFGGGRRRGAE